MADRGWRGAHDALPRAQGAPRDGLPSGSSVHVRSRRHRTVTPFADLLTLARPRFDVFVLGVFGVAALILATIGPYAVMGADVRQGTSLLAFCRRSIVPSMSLLLILIILLVLLGGGGFYAGGPRVGGGLVGLILLIIIVLALTGRL